MPSERVQRQIDRLLDEAEEAIRADEWQLARQRAQAVLDLDPENEDAPILIAGADRAAARAGTASPGSAPVVSQPASTLAGSSQPTSFAGGRYTVTRFLGEGGKKKVYLARDSRLDRSVAFALIKTEGLDEASRVRVQREAEAMGRLGAHPHIVTVFDIGEENGQPYLVLPVLAGGDVEGVIEKAPENKLTIEHAIKIAVDTCLGLEFAHSKGIVHRDLKPGNVWLTEDGRAMIGDFGLAVAVDKSRLTQAGMMVGTVNYMPPEQAMGGEVGPRSDLSSLGAMLYEMVCGRPPFVGDESVAIIGQHLSTPPVAPSWHRTDCPPALEALILRLLEKDPSKRPASATEVREALESVTTSATPRQATVAQEIPAGENPLYRRTFVGRENEVRQLQQAFDAALSGQGGLVMVVGEPGIGKTAVCEQLATYVALRGGKALVGHCYEEGSLSLPYLAFVEAMRSYVLAREPDGLRSDLGTGAADVARIVSEVRDRVQGVELRPAGDPEDDRWRLLQAITSFIRNASTVQPLCIVLEDLHWADRGTLDLLLHASRNLQGARLLIVGTYRDVEVDRSHPLSSALGDLRRGANFVRVPLRGLTVDEVHRMYQALRGQDVAWAQAEIVHRQTEGHPLFVQEVLRYLVEEGIVVRQDGRYQVKPGDEASDAVIPEGLRDVVGRRLSHLSEKTNQALAVAAIIGREFRLDVLQRVLELTEEDLFVALEEAQERAIIEPRQVSGGMGFRFTHAFFRQTLYEEIFAPRRIRMHQRVGRALEETYARRLDEHAAEMAEHFSQGTETDDLLKAVQYGQLAAARSSNVHAFNEAARHLEQALKAQEVLDPDNKHELCAILLDLSTAVSLGGAPARALAELTPKALNLARDIGDADSASRACQVSLSALFNLQAAASWFTPEAAYWAEEADRWAPPNTLHRVRADCCLARVCVEQGLVDEASRRSSAALDLAIELNDNAAIWFAEAEWLQTYTDPRLLLSNLEMARALLARPRDGVSLDVLRTAFVGAINCQVQAGRFDEAMATAIETRLLAERTRQPNLELVALHMQGWKFVADGQLEAAVSLAKQILDKGRESAVESYASASAWIAGNLALYYLGSHHHPSLLIEVVWSPMLLLNDLISDERRAAAEGLYRERVERFRTVWPFRLSWLWEPALRLNDLVTLEQMRRTYEGTDVVISHPFLPMSIDRLLSDTCLALGDYEAARSHYENAIRTCESLPHRPELALAHLGYAELLLEHYPDEHDAAIEHLDFAIAELRDMKMQPALERALRHRGLLKA